MVTTLILTGVFTAITFASMIYMSAAHWSIKSAALILFLLIGAFSFNVFVDMLGAPIPARPQGEHAYIWHTITPEPAIVIWTINAKRGYRLYKYEYTREEAAKLEELRKSAMEGRPQELVHFGDPTDGDDLQILSIPNRNYTKQ